MYNDILGDDYMLKKHFRIKIGIFGVGLLLVLLVLGMVPKTDSAFQNEPGDFRGMKWRANISEFSGMHFIAADADLRFYDKRDENIQIGDGTVSKIIYGFYKDNLYSVLVYFDGLINYSKLKEIYVQKYGQPFQPNEYVNKYFWNGDNVDILLTYDDVMKHGRITYFYKPLGAMIEEDEKLKAKKGADDL
jgi:hypothetical protein